MSNMEGDNDSEKPKGSFTTLMGNAKWLYQKREYRKAIDSFTMAVTMKPNDKNAYIGRSKCFMDMGQPENALKDAESSLKIDKTFCEGLYQKAEALYHMAEFEFALVFYHRGNKLRPQSEGFRLGIQKAQEAIENAIGVSSSIKLELKGDLSFLKEDEEREKPIAAIQNLTEKRQTTQKIPKNEKTARKLLGDFYSDRKFLENLMKDEDLIKSRTRSGEPLGDVLQSCLAHLDMSTKVLNQAKPIGPQGKGPKGTPKKPTSRHSAFTEPAPMLLTKSLNEIDAELASGNAEGSLKKAEEVMETVQKWSDKEVPNKKEVLGRLHSCIGKALFELGDMDKALKHQKKDLELAKQCKLPEATSRALGNIGRVYAQSGQFEKAIEFWKNKIPLARDGLEKAWLFHELGMCYLELNHSKEAREYGVRSLAAAKETADGYWQINANVLVARSELNLGNVESCVSYFETALSLAKLGKDDPAMIAIQKALDDATQRPSSLKIC